MIQLMSGNRVATFSQEDMAFEIEKMLSLEVLDAGIVTICSGDHPEYGKVHAVIPAMGEAYLLLPF